MIFAPHLLPFLIFKYSRCKRSSSHSSHIQWVKFLDTISSRPEIVFEYIKGNENNIADFLSRYLISDKAQEEILSSKDRQLIEGISTK